MRFLLSLSLILLLGSCTEQRPTIVRDTRLSKQETIKLCFAKDLGPKVMQEKCDRIFLSGNLPEKSQLKAFSAPLFQVNPRTVINLLLDHDDHEKDPAQWITFAKNDRRFFFPNYYYLVDYGGLCFVTIDTTFYSYRELPQEGKEQEQWLKGLKPRLNKCEVKIAVTNNSHRFLAKFSQIKFDRLIDISKNGYEIMTWSKSHPSQIAVTHKTAPDVAMERQEAPPPLEVEDIIDKKVVEQGPFTRLKNMMKSFFSLEKPKEKKKAQVKKEFPERKITEE